jgi:cytosine/adenosine deaminase-related metal-dependent hydrolase
MQAMNAAPAWALVNADLGGGTPGVLRFHGSRILPGTAVERGDHVVDLRGDRVLPGLINAHDHLHRNHYPRLRFRARYDNAADWAADIDARRSADRLLVESAALPRGEAFAQGALKNLLSGVTSVAHHDSGEPGIHSSNYPVRVVGNCGWAHSLSMDGPERVRESHRGTPADAPWFIHAGEGTDEAAAREAGQLAELGVLTANTVLVHGLGFSATDRARLVSKHVGLAWCPGSNQFLYGRSAAVAEFAQAGLLALGSDSRLSGERDLLDELRVARDTGEVDDSRLESLVTGAAASLLRLGCRGTLRAGADADLLVLPRGARLWELRRADLRAVLIGGDLRYADTDLAASMAKNGERVQVDGRIKWLTGMAASWLRRPGIREPGVQLQ